MNTSNFLYFFYKNIENRYFRKFLLKVIYIKDKGQAFSGTLRKIYHNIYKITVGYGSYGGCFNHDNIPPNVEFGNYCSIASGVRVFRANHPAELFTTHPILFNPIMGYASKDKLQRPPLKIGHDVWIGSGTIISPKVMVIGNGAIIGAGSVVTKDVPPYSIVAGNPARIIRMRFSEETIMKLEDTKWWLLSKEDLICRISELNKIANSEI